MPFISTFRTSLTSGSPHGAVEGNERLTEKAVATGADGLHDALPVLLVCVGIPVIVVADF